MHLLLLALATTTLAFGPSNAFQVDDEKASAVVEQDSVEGIQGTHDGRIVTEQRGPKGSAKN